MSNDEKNTSIQTNHWLCRLRRWWAGINESPQTSAGEKTVRLVVNYNYIIANAEGMMTPELAVRILELARIV